MSFDEACAAVVAPGAPFETATAVVDGRDVTVFRNAPESLRVVVEAAMARGEATFLVYEDERWSFDRFGDRVRGLASALVEQYGVEPGDRVAVAMRNYPEWVVAFAAAVSVGAISVSFNAWWTEEEMAFALGDCTPRVLIADAERVERSRDACARLGVATVAVRAPGAGGPDLRHWDDVVVPGRDLPSVAVGPDDDATILYTSGTTGHPKGAVSTHRAVVHALYGYACRSAVDKLRAPAAPEPALRRSFILVVPLFHVTGCVPVMLSCMLAGLKLVMMHKWQPERALELIEREQVTNFVGVPTQNWDLLSSPEFGRYDTSSLRNVGGGGAPAPPELVRRMSSGFRRASPGIGYGMTETNAYGPQNGGADYVERPTSAGRTVPIMQVEVRDPDGRPVPTGELGEIWFRGPNLIRGYWNRPDATAEALVDGWLRSGDIGRVDADGFVYVEDRVKDMVLRGGENVYCAEVEAVLYEHPAVHEAAVFGVPHERLGEEVAAAVMLRAGAEATVQELQDHVAAHLAAFKVPTRVVITAEPLPRNASGKIQKRELRASIS